MSSDSSILVHFDEIVSQSQAEATRLQMENYNLTKECAALAQENSDLRKRVTNINNNLADVIKEREENLQRDLKAAAATGELQIALTELNSEKALVKALQSSNRELERENELYRAENSRLLKSYHSRAREVLER